MRNRHLSTRALIIILCMLAFISLFAATLLGSTTLSLKQVTSAWLYQGSAADQLIVWQIRLPRALAAFSVGAALGLSGAALQGLLRNPLAEPGVLGVSASASLAATTVLYYGWVTIGFFTLPLAAISGALLATTALVWVSWRTPSIAQLLLVGIGLSSFAAALMALLMNIAPNPFSLAELVNWMLGSVANKSLRDLVLTLPFMCLGAAIVYTQHRGLNAMTLGEEAAIGVGVDIARLRIGIILGTGLLTGAAVALAGAIGFVGIVAPHIIRPWVASTPSAVLLPSSLLAGCLLVIADIIVRLLPTNNELQLGVVAALMGAPLFVWIVIATSQKMRA